MDSSRAAPTEKAIQHFSAKKIPPRMRLDYWMSILQESVWPVSEWSGVKDFDFELKEAPLGILTATTQTVSAHRSHRTVADVSRSGDRKFLLFAGDLPWEIEHKGHRERILQGDCVLVDSELEHEINCPSGYKGVVLRLPVNWLLTWLPNADSLVGQRIAGDSKWGSVISPIVNQFTPELAAAPPLPHGVLADQLGVTLSLIATEFERRDQPDLLRKILNCIRERCTESQLTGTEVASGLDIPPRLLHRVLAANRLTFAALLVDARISVAQQLLASPSSLQLTTEEIAQRAGFATHSDFSQVMRKRTVRRSEKSLRSKD